MKTCEEMVSSLLRRRADYEVKRKARRQTVLRISTVACSLALVLFVGTGMGQGWWIITEPELPTVTPTQVVTEPAEPMLQTPTTEPSAPTEVVQITVQPMPVDHIVINEIDGITSDRMYICLHVDDFVPMSADELNDYFGINIFPEVPEDLGAEWSDREGIQRGIYRRAGGTGEIYHDQQVLNWSNEDFSRSVNIELRKGGMPFQCFAVLTAEHDPSIINNVEVGIGQTDEGIYLVEFMYRDVGFRMIAEGLSQEELVAVVASLIQF